MPKRFNTKIGPRDIDILMAFDRTPLTPSQLCSLSQTFAVPFLDEHNLRRRLRRLADSGLVKSWPYAIVTDGRSPRYFKLTREGYRLLHGADAALPRRRYFEEISHGHHYHTHALAETIVHVAVSGHGRGINLNQFARENSVKLQAGGFTMFPDCAFRIATPDNRGFNFVLELDNGTERVRTKQDVESIERKLRGYDAHQSQFAANDPQRYVVLFITTRGDERLRNIMQLADAVMQNRHRTVFIGTGLRTLTASDPFSDAIFEDHRGLKRTLIPQFNSEWKTKESVKQVSPTVLI